MHFRKLTVLAVFFVLLTMGQSWAEMIVRAESPQASGGTIPLDADFSIDVWIDQNGNDNGGGGFSFGFYGTGTIQHVSVTGGDPSYPSIQYINNFATYFGPGLIFPAGNGFDGNFPDSINFSFLTFGVGLPASNPDLPYIRFNMHSMGIGTICIDSITHQSLTDWDWLFPDYISPVTFNGPYCWTIGSSDNPPQIVCPGGIVIGCTDFTDPAHTGMAEATDDSGLEPTIDYSDAVSGVCPVIITRTWTATDDQNQTSSCVQQITIEDNDAPVITCPADITVQQSDPTDPGFTGSATATDCDLNPTITYSDLIDDNIISRTWRAADDCNNFSECLQTITIDVGTDVGDETGNNLPSEFALLQNHPNPFNPATSIEFALPTASQWTLSIYNLIGQKITEFRDHSEAGYVTIQWDASRMPSGLYFYRLEAGSNFVASKKMILLK